MDNDQTASNTLNELVPPSEELIGFVLDVLEVKGPARRKLCANFLAAHVQGFRVGRVIWATYRSDHEEIHHIRNLKDLVRTFTERMNTIQPKFRMLLALAEEGGRFSDADWKNRTPRKTAGG